MLITLVKPVPKAFICKGADGGDKLSMSAGGSTVPHIIIDTTGNIGIGTTNPTKKLDIKQ